MGQVMIIGMFIIIAMFIPWIRNWNKQDDVYYEEHKPIGLINCPACGKLVSGEAKECNGCGHPINTSVVCPKCGSKNTKVISSSSKTASVFLVGVFAASKVLSKYECNRCGNKFNV